MATRCTIVWFRRDLRLEDNPALTLAVRSGPVIPLFIWSPEDEGQFQPGRVSRWWLKHSLMHLNESLESLGAPLIVRRSKNALSALLDVIRETGATQVFYNHLYDPISLVRDHGVREGLARAGIVVNNFNADLLYEPWKVSDIHGKPVTTFASFWSRCLSMDSEPEAPLLPPRGLVKFSGRIPSCPIDSLNLEDDSERDSNALLARTWSPGWSNADKMLETFTSGALSDYALNHGKVDGATTSFLSPHLHFGELSVRKIFQHLRMKLVLWCKEGRADGKDNINLFLKSIGYREYSRYLCFNFPFTHEKLLLPNMRTFPWRVDEGYFKAWRQGRTGYPLVDAGMREIWATGWIHNRIRVIVSSFYVKFLQLPWKWGMKYFWDALLDADLENDILGWQYISGGLPDGHEFDRMDNPQTEGYQYDPDGEYVRRWLPELSRLPTEWIHHPWDAPPKVLRAAGVELGCNYPRPIVEFVAARQRLVLALADMQRVKTSDEQALAAPDPQGHAPIGDQVVDSARLTTSGAVELSPQYQKVPSIPGESPKELGTSNLQYQSVARTLVDDVSLSRSTPKALRKSSDVCMSSLQAQTSQLPNIDDTGSAAESSRVQKMRKRAFGVADCSEQRHGSHFPEQCQGQAQEFRLPDMQGGVSSMRPSRSLTEGKVEFLGVTERDSHSA